MVKNLLHLRDKRQDVVPQVTCPFKHCVELFVNVFMEIRREIGLYLDVPVDDEIPHLFISELQCMSTHFRNLHPLFFGFDAIDPSCHVEVVCILALFLFENLQKFSVSINTSTAHG